MTIYWLLFAFPAIMALAYPISDVPIPLSTAQRWAMTMFIILYTLIGGLREEIGGDWLNYLNIFEDIRTDTFVHAVTAIEPYFGMLNWLSAQAGLGIYLVNGACCLILVYGVVKVAEGFKEPWLAILIAVPYLLIVVGMGYVRQGAAIGFILLAIRALDRQQPILTLVFLWIAVGFHNAAVMVLPLFVFALMRRYRIFAVLFAIVAVFAFYYILAPRLDTYQTNYLEAEYSSGGATARVLMSLIPSLLLLARLRHFPASPRIKIFWIAVAVANCLAALALVLSPSSTAVDRVALFFAMIQMAVFGEMRSLAGASRRTVPALRIALIGVAAALQVVWLTFGTYSSFWVPYNSILQLT